MTKQTNSARCVRWAALSLLLGAGAATADISDKAPPAGGRIPVTKVADLELVPWTLGGVLTNRPKGTRDVVPGEPERVYDNTSRASMFYHDPQPSVAGDDISFYPAVGAPVNPVISLAGPMRITGVEFAMYVNPGPNGETDFDAYCSFYDSVDRNGSPVNSEFLGGFFIQLRGVLGERSYTTGPVDFRTLIPGGILVPDEDVFVELRFTQPGAYSMLSDRATPVLSGAGVTLGSSADIFWASNEPDALFGPEDALTFGGAPLLANLYLALDAVVEPPCQADFNHDSLVNTQDLFDFLALFFVGDEGADFNQDGTVGSQDYFDFLTAYFAGCP